MACFNDASCGLDRRRAARDASSDSVHRTHRRPPLATALAEAGRSKHFLSAVDVQTRLAPLPPSSKSEVSVGSGHGSGHDRLAALAAA